MMAGLPCCDPCGDGRLLSRTGTYMLYNRITRKPYIGVTSGRFGKRMGRHLSGAGCVNADFRADFEKHGREAFDRYLLEVHILDGMTYDEKRLFVREQEDYWINEAKDKNGGWSGIYNVTNARLIGLLAGENERPVRQLLPEGGYVDWRSSSDVERETGMCGSYISDCCREQTSAHGFEWVWIVKVNPERLFNPDKIDRALVMPRKTFCRQFLPEGGYVDWQSPSDVERETGMGGKGIARCLSGGRLSAYGFKWKRMEGEPERLFNPAKMDRALVMPRK